MTLYTEQKDVKQKAKAAEPPVIAVDIGNTRVHLGLVDTADPGCMASTAFPTGSIAEELVVALENLIATTRCAPPHNATVSGVVRNAADTAVELLVQRGFHTIRLCADTKLPFVIRYADPAMLGADRIANAIYGISRFPTQPLILVSAGTAVTVDYIADGAFLGGAILPGTALQLLALHSHTDALPHVAAITAELVAELPARSTEACIACGVLYGIAGSIAAIAQRYVALCPENAPTLIATGGDWPLLAPHFPMQHTHVADMTLIGAGCYWVYHTDDAAI